MVSSESPSGFSWCERVACKAIALPRINFQAPLKQLQDMDFYIFFYLFKKVKTALFEQTL